MTNTLNYKSQVQQIYRKHINNWNVSHTHMDFETDRETKTRKRLQIVERSETLDKKGERAEQKARSSIEKENGQTL